MTLDEAIKHAKEVAKQNEDDAVVYSNCKNHKKNLYEIGLAENAEKKCRKCSKEHRQLAEWLKELKRQREAWQAIRHDIIELKPEFGYWLIDGDSVKQAVCETVNEALIIIDKHLKEVTTDADRD